MSDIKCKGSQKHAGAGTCKERRQEVAKWIVKNKRNKISGRSEHLLNLVARDGRDHEDVRLLLTEFEHMVPA